MFEDGEDSSLRIVYVEEARASAELAQAPPNVHVMNPRLPS